MPKDLPRRGQTIRSKKTKRAVAAGGPPGDAKTLKIVGIGASAGGLDACKKLMSALPDDTGMAFILVQHLDPTHESLMSDLLKGLSSLIVLQATDGTQVERDHLYIIPPGTYLSIQSGTLHLSQPKARHGARLPVDFLLESLAAECGTLATCVILSGIGADGSEGLKAIKANGGLVIVQDPAEAGFDGMPRSAIMTGLVDFVLPTAKIPGALIAYHPGNLPLPEPMKSLPTDESRDWLPSIIELIRTETAHDFTYYKEGTLQRRIERRVGMLGIPIEDMTRYLDRLRSDPAELELLAEDLLINVTGFFRDPKVFDVLAKTIIPDLVRNQSVERPLRIWIAGCSTGEETYSIAMLFYEEISISKRNIKLQVFASDVDPDAIAVAREGLYPETITAHVSSARLSRFFLREGLSYRILPVIRAAVVFTVQDILGDAPFANLDMVSCRNLLIYLHPDAQAKVFALFHFALRDGGVLLLGSSETIASSDARFAVISKPERLYRHVGHSRPGELALLISQGGAARTSTRPPLAKGTSRQTVLADLCQKMLAEVCAPAAVLINQKHECLYFLGPTDKFLHVTSGAPTHDLFAMVRDSLRIKLRSAIQKASQTKTRVVVAGGKVDNNSVPHFFSIAVQPTVSDGEKLLLICFVDQVEPERNRGPATKANDETQISALEHELETTRTELEDAIRNLEISSEEQKTINDEALSINEEYQSTNEELLTSKEELQSLNEELTALNGQLQETLERQRTTSNDLQNVLYSTDVATIFLDTNLDIRFFTPATKSLFNVIPSDVGRPFADLNLLASDGALLSDARSVLQDTAPIEREIEATDGTWYIRRILPYRTQDGKVEGVVITFADNTERKHAANALESAKRLAEQADVAKSRFLAAASHDLRQPLQTLTLLQSLLAESVEGEKAKTLVFRLEQTLATMAEMLNTLLDINQIEAGTIHVDLVNFPVNDLLERLKQEFSYIAQAQKLDLRVIPCGLSIRSDPRLLEQMIRNLVANALKYTKRGKVLLGCRRREGLLSIQVWDTGSGIPEAELEAIFEEYHQLDNAPSERGHGFGLGLAIVQRLGHLMGQRVDVRSKLGKGSVFTVEAPYAPKGAAQPKSMRRDSDEEADDCIRQGGKILVVEDDLELRQLLEHFLKEEGYSVAGASDGAEALGLVQQGGVRADLVLADCNLPYGMNGLQVAAKVRQKLKREIPVIILTGDISTMTLHDIARRAYAHLNKPVKLKELLRVIRRLLPSLRPSVSPIDGSADAAHPATIFVVDDESDVREGIRALLEGAGRIVETFSTCDAFLAAYRPGQGGCLLVDADLPGMNGLELLEQLKESGDHLPAVMITGKSDVAVAVRAMKAGALDFIEKPFAGDELLVCLNRALEHARDDTKLFAWHEDARISIAGLTLREREIMDLVLAGHPNKNIAADLGISQRTVESHRASIMKKTGSKSLPELVRLALAASG